LIERLGRKAHATAPGRQLIEPAHRIARECEAAGSAMRGLRDGWLGRVHIGSTLTALMYDLLPILRRHRGSRRSGKKSGFGGPERPRKADIVECRPT